MQRPDGPADGQALLLYGAVILLMGKKLVNDVSDWVIFTVSIVDLAQESHHSILLIWVH